MSSVISLNADSRNTMGKGSARALRRSGKTPAIIYGGGKQNVSIALDSKQITKEYYKEGFTSQVFEIKLQGETLKVIPKAVQLHPVTDVIEHMDFFFVSKDAKIHVMVKIHILNEDKCMGIKRGGILNLVRREIEIICSPDSIPHSIDIDVSSLNIGDSVHIEDITLPKDVKVALERNFTILTVAGRGSDEEETAAQATTPEAKS